MATMTAEISEPTGPKQERYTALNCIYFIYNKCVK